MITGKLLGKSFKAKYKKKGANGFIQKPFKMDEILNFL
jgi:FixJ family two-component response regulator